MELAVSIIAILLAFWLFHKLGGISRQSTDSQKLSGQEGGPNDKAGLSPAIELVLGESADGPNTESGETITVIVADDDPFHEEWEVIPHSDTDEDPHRSATVLSPKKH